MHIYEWRQRCPVLRQHSPDVPGNSKRIVQAFPTKQLRSPGHICIFAVGKEIGVKEFAINRNIVDHLTPVQAGGSSAAEHVLAAIILPFIRSAASAVEMSQVGGHVNSR